MQAGGMPEAPPSSAGGRVRFGVQVAPDSISVGDPFQLVVRLQVPAGARIRWPRLADSTADVVMDGDVRLADQDTRIGWQEWRAVYDLRAWNIGRVPIGLPPIVVHVDGSGDSVLVPLDATARVRSVLPGDTTLHVPKPARDLFPRVTPWWTQWWPALVTLAVLAAFLLWRSRRVRRRSSMVPTIDPYREAIEGFVRLETLHLAAAGEAGRAAILALDIVRTYLERRLGADPSATSAELLVQIAADDRVPLDRLVSLLAEVDALKFAARIISGSRAQELIDEARALVDEIERAEMARREAEVAAMEAARLAAHRAQADHEEAARRASRRPAGRGAWTAPWTMSPLAFDNPLPMLWAHPWLLIGLLAIPLWFWWYRRGGAAGSIVFSQTARLARGPQRRSHWVRWLPWLRAGALTALLLAIAGPRGPGRPVRSPGAGIDIVLTVDISSSMLAEDFQPQNRLEVAKDKVKRFVVGRTSDRVGLVAFSGEALTQVPLTTDYPVVLAAVDNLQVGQLEDGTAIGTAIATAANRLRRASGRSRVMVLLTDGESNRGTIDPRTAAQAAAAFGIRIYTIGVGSEGTAPVPVGRGVFGLRYENRPVKIDEALLTEIATTSGGRYFRARDAAALEAIYGQIDRLERTVADTRGFVRFTEWFRWPAAFAALLLLIELAIRSRREVLP